MVRLFRAGKLLLPRILPLHKRSTINRSMQKILSLCLDDTPTHAVLHPALSSSAQQGHGLVGAERNEMNVPLQTDDVNLLVDKEATGETISFRKCY